MRQPAVYVASKSIHGPQWRALRDAGLNIISMWIDESGEGQTVDWAALWDRCIAETKRADVLLLLHEPHETPKGSLVEMGAALAKGLPIFYVGSPDLLSALKHRNVRTFNTLPEAIAAIATLRDELRA